MFRYLCLLPCALMPVALAAQAPAAPLKLEHRMLLRCSAAFSLVAVAQENGDAAALSWPDLSVRGKEFFVRASARVMDEAGLNREQLGAALNAEANDIVAKGNLAQIMPPCMNLLPSN